jgi:hypothetical protein
LDVNSPCSSHSETKPTGPQATPFLPTKNPTQACDPSKTRWTPSAHALASTDTNPTPPSKTSAVDDTCCQKLVQIPSNVYRTAQKRHVTGIPGEQFRSRLINHYRC